MEDAISQEEEFNSQCSWLLESVIYQEPSPSGKGFVLNRYPPKMSSDYLEMDHSMSVLLVYKDYDCQIAM